MKRNEVIAILQELLPGVDVEHETGFITGKVIDSIVMMQLITELEEKYDVEIDMEYMDAAHFDSLDAILDMLDELE